MNTQRVLFGRITINGEKIMLGRAYINEMMVRVTQQYIAAKSRGDINIIVELRDSPLPESSTLSREQQLEQEMLSNIQLFDPDDESPFEGISMGRMNEAIMSPEHEAYRFLCEPANRVGVDQPTIDRIKREYHDKFPDCFAAFPAWVES